jgi:hypothetical protein
VTKQGTDFCPRSSVLRALSVSSEKTVILAASGGAESGAGKRAASEGRQRLQNLRAGPPSCLEERELRGVSPAVSMMPIQIRYRVLLKGGVMPLDAPSEAEPLTDHSGWAYICESG